MKPSKLKLSGAAAGLVLCASAMPAMAAPFTIDFEGAGSFSSILEFYNGGTDGAGNSGPSLGISFTGAALALSNDELGPYFSNAPTPGTVMALTDSSAVLNSAAGFSGYASFYYSSAISSPSSINIYSGLNGTGSVLGTFSLNNNAEAGCSGPYCNFEKTSVVFSGVGHSIGFGGAGTQVAFDNVVLSAVPESSTYVLMALGLVGIGLVVKRRAD